MWLICYQRKLLLVNSMYNIFWIINNHLQRYVKILFNFSYIGIFISNSDIKSITDQSYDLEHVDSMPQSKKLFTEPIGFSSPFWSLLRCKSNSKIILPFLVCFTIKTWHYYIILAIWPSRLNIIIYNPENEHYNCPCQLIVLIIYLKL